MKTLGSIVWIIFSFIMIVGGAIGLFAPLDVFANLVFLLPIFLLVGGVGSLLYYIDVRAINGANFIFIDGLLSILFGVIFLISGIELTALVVISLVGFVVIFKGILGLGYAFELKRSQLSWVWVFIFSLLNIIIAFIFILYPSIGGITIGIMFSLLILFFGVTSFMGWLGSRKLFND